MYLFDSIINLKNSGLMILDFILTCFFITLIMSALQFDWELC